MQAPGRDEADWSWFFQGLHRAQLDARAREADLRARLERARSAIHRRYEQPLDLDALARQAAFSRYHFLREFRRQFDATPHQYLTRRRLEAAKELLQNTDLSVTQVCLAVGYSSLGSFSTLFQRHLGHSPQRYRSRLVQVPRWPPMIPRIPACFVMKLGSTTF